MRCRHQERLWKEYLRDPSLWWDFRKTKTTPGAPDFKHKFTQELLWLEGAQSATWVTENRTILNKTRYVQRVPTSKEEEKEGKGDRKMVNSSIRNDNIWAALSLLEIIPALEDGSLPMPSVSALSCILQKCRKERDLAHALRLHAYIGQNGWEGHTSIGNELVLTLVDIGSMNVAQQSFDTLTCRSEASWNAMIMGYIKCGKPENALSLYQLMQKDGSISPNGPLFVALIKACARVKDMENGYHLHAELARTGLLERDPFIGSSLLDMYVECNFLAKAQELFDKLRVRDVVAWNALLGGYIKWGHAKKVLECFKRLRMEGVFPDGVTFVYTLKACCCMGAVDKGQEVHADIERKGLLERDLFIGSVLVDMYAKCGLLIKAQEVLDRLPVRDIVCWTALITGYAEQGYGEDCLNSFAKMHHEGFAPNSVTLICCLKACGSIGAIDKAAEMHAEIERRGLLENDHPLGSALVDMYVKCGSLVKAQEVFDALPARNVVAWTTLISGYAEHGHGEEALNCFEKLQANGVSPDAVAFMCILKACGNLGAIDKGLEIHSEIEKQGLLKTDEAVGNALVDMYARCGSLAMAQRVFDSLPDQGIVSWNSLIAGYAQLGEIKKVFCLFDRMLKDAVEPDLVTFVIVLEVCSQAGLYDKGETYFKAMSKDYDILPVLEHHTCMLDLLGRAGLLEKAVTLIERLPLAPDLAVWHTVLGACKKWGNVELGRQAFEHAVRLDERDGAAYVMMSSIYANADMEEEVKNLEAMRVEKQARKGTGRYWWNDSV